jgi:septation ring formation regulator EzrA
MSRPLILVSVLSAALLAPALAFAQEDNGNAPPPPPSQNDNGGNHGNHHANQQQFREHFEKRLKENLKVTDDEWKVIQPKLQKVFEARRDTMGGMFGPRRNHDDNNQPKSAVQKAAHDLQKTLDNTNASADDIAKQLQDLRDAREKAKANLASAQKDLKDVLTQRQEAVLVMMGILD